MTKLILISGLVFAAACGGKSGGAADPCADPCKGKMAAMTCDGMADAVAASMSTTGDMPEDVLSEMRAVFARECTTTGWSQESIDCMAAATNEGAGEACADAMTEEQRSSLMDAMEAASGEMEDGDGMDEGGGGMDDAEGME